MTQVTSSFSEHETGDLRHKSRTIFLVNQISGHGHLDLYARLYSACALELGHRVVLIAEHDGGVRDWLRAHERGHVDRFSFLSRAELRREPGLAQRVAAALWSPFDRVLAYAARRWLVARRVRSALFPPRGVSFRPLVHETRAAADRLGTRPDLLFFLYLDLMDDSADGCRALDEGLNVPFAGILFHPRANDTDGSGAERYFGSTRARGAAFLNPHRLEPYQRRFPALAFDTVPDVTDATLPDAVPTIVTEIQRRARGRTIVALLGSVTPDKGLTDFMEVVRRADAGDYFFVIAGEIFWQSFGAAEQAVRQFAGAPPENCLVHPSYFPDERTLNAVIAATDILYAVYPNQRDSSNTLTKAAIFEKPVIVSDAHLMGERVRDFGLGVTVRFGDTAGVLDALRRLRDANASSFGYAAYRDAHSFDALKTSFGALVHRWARA